MPEAAARGCAIRTIRALRSAMAGPTDVLGRSLIVHARPDDYATQPAGNSGDCIACGLIVSG
jgi:Cu-Zn family superoxide dismutase